MKHLTPNELEQVALDIELELKQLSKLEADIAKVQQHQAHAAPELVDILYENLAFKLQNFYMGCERIFEIIVTELNGTVPTGAHWHKRLLERMTVAHAGRPAVISEETATALRVYLGFRHVVRNIYGYELDSEQVAYLITQYQSTWHQFHTDIRAFIDWLNRLAAQLGE